MQAAVGLQRRGTTTAPEEGTGLQEEGTQGRDSAGAEQWNRLTPQT